MASPLELVLYIPIESIQQKSESILHLRSIKSIYSHLQIIHIQKLQCIANAIIMHEYCRNRFMYNWKYDISYKD